MFHRFLELSGRFFFQKLRTPFFLLLLATGPLLSSFFLFSEKQTTEVFQDQFSSIAQKAKTAFAKKTRKEKFLETHKNSDPYFLDKEIESLAFLETEKARLKSWLTHPAIANKEALKKRLSFLEGRQNRLSFVDDEIQLGKSCKETLEKQRERVEVDVEDLKHLLALIEEIQGEANLKRPQLLICDFSLKKKATELQNEIYELKMDLLKREFL